MFNLLTLAERQSFRIAETVGFRKISTPLNQVKLQYFLQCWCSLTGHSCFKKLQVSAAGLFKYVWSFNEDRALKALCKKYPYSEFFWSVFSRIQGEYGERLLCIQFECWKLGTRKTSNTETFHTVRVNDCWTKN